MFRGKIEDSEKVLLRQSVKKVLNRTNYKMIFLGNDFKNVRNDFRTFLIILNLLSTYMHTAKIAGGILFCSRGVKNFRACGAKFSKIPHKSEKIAKNRRFSVIFTLKPKNFRQFFGGGW